MADNSASPNPTPGTRSFIASPWHTLSILLIFGYFSFRDAQHARVPESAQAALSHAAVLRYYFISIAYEWGMAYWAFVGVHWKGGQLSDLTGGRWTSWRSLALDVAIAIPFWGVWELTAWLVHLAVDRVRIPTTPYQAPSGFAEIFMWILLSISAGVCEELVFRGYLQKQFHVATHSIAAAVILQGIIFGMVHAYQGWKQVIVIVPLGIL
jgi:CAAX protease family protein